MSVASTTSLMRLTSSLVPVNGVSQMPTTGHAVHVLQPALDDADAEHVGHEEQRLAVVPCTCSSSSTMRGCEPSGSVM